MLSNVWRTYANHNKTDARLRTKRGSGHCEDRDETSDDGRTHWVGNVVGLQLSGMSLALPDGEREGAAVHVPHERLLAAQSSPRSGAAKEDASFIAVDLWDAFRSLSVGPFDTHEKAVSVGFLAKNARKAGINTHRISL